MNRDSVKLIAERYNATRKGLFIFISAERSIIPVLQKYSDLKEEAE
jgi:hypothetical protein